MAGTATDIVSKLPLVVYDIIGGHNGFVNPIREPRLHVLRVKKSLKPDGKFEDVGATNVANRSNGDDNDTSDELNDVEESTDTDDTDTDADSVGHEAIDQADIGEAFQLFLNDSEFVVPCM